MIGFKGWPSASGLGTTSSVTDVSSGATRSGRSLVFGTPGVYAVDIVTTGDYAYMDCFAWGGGGGGSGSVGGGGAFKSARCKVLTGRYYVVVGGGGDTRGSGAGLGTRPAGFGGLSGINGYGGQGGGLSGLFRGMVSLPKALLIAAGGGGSGYDNSSIPGGAGGDTTGQDGSGTSPGRGASLTGEMGSNYGLGVWGTVPPLEMFGGDCGSQSDGGGGGGGGAGARGGGPGRNDNPGSGGGGGCSFADQDICEKIASEAGSGQTAGGGSHRFYPGSGTVGTGGAITTAGKRGHLILTW